MWRATWRGLVAHKARVSMTALAVVLGVAFVAGTLVLTDTINSTFDRLFSDVSSGVDVAVRTPALFRNSQSPFEDREPVAASLLERVRAVPGVRAAEGDLSGYAQLVDARGQAIETTGAPTLGVNWSSTPGLGPLRLRKGRPPRGDGEVVIDAVTARQRRLSVGEHLTILFQGSSGRFRVVGITGFGRADNLAGATLAAFDTATAQRVLGRTGRYDAIHVQAGPGISETQLRRRLVRALPPSLEVITGADLAAESASSVKKALGPLRIGLLVFAGISLFVGAFIIFNTFSIVVTQRSRELGLLRALGASRGQVTRSVLAEAATVGLLASVAGLVVGVTVARGLQALFGAFGFGLPSSGMRLVPRTVVVSLVVGTGVTCVAALLPARRAARVSPMAALRDARSTPSSLRRRLAGGLVLSAAGVALMVVGLFAGTPQPAALVGAGAMAAFVGAAMLSPLFARPAAAALGRPLPRLLGVPGTLARNNAMRNPRRTATTAVALMVGMGVVTVVSVLSSSLKASINRSVDRALGADYVLSARQFSGFGTDVAQRLRQGEGVEAATSVKTGEWRLDQAQKRLFAADPGAIGTLVRIDAAPGAVDALGRGEVLVWDKEAEEQGWKVGDRIPMGFARTGRQQVRIGGTFAVNDFGNYVVSSSFYERNYASTLDFLVLVKADPARPSQVARRTVDRVVAATPSVQAHDRGEFKRSQQSEVNRALGMMYALLGLAVLIAVLGIMNTLALSVLERTREIGLVRAVGMSQRQVRRMIRWESVIIALFGAVLGLVAGMAFGWALVRALDDQGVTDLVWPVGTLASLLVLAGFAGVAAATMPARRAARLDVLAALASE